MAILGTTLVIAQSGGPMSSRDNSPGTVAASAIKELLSGQSGGEVFREMMQDRSDTVADGAVLVQDPYPAWLAAELIRQAAVGQLFVGGGDKISLRFTTWDIGDGTFWYIGRVSAAKPDGSRAAAGGPWVLWGNYGAELTPNGPEDNPWVEEYALSSVSEGDIVEFDLYRLPRDFVDSLVRLDASAALADESAHLLLRLQLPVTIRQCRD